MDPHRIGRVLPQPILPALNSPLPFLSLRSPGTPGVNKFTFQVPVKALHPPRQGWGKIPDSISLQNTPPRDATVGSDIAPPSGTRFPNLCPQPGPAPFQQQNPSPKTWDFYFPPPLKKSFYFQFGRNGRPGIKEQNFPVRKTNQPSHSHFPQQVPTTDKHRGTSSRFPFPRLPQKPAAPHPAFLRL